MILFSSKLYNNINNYYVNKLSTIISHHASIIIDKISLCSQHLLLFPLSPTSLEISACNMSYAKVHTVLEAIDKINLFNYNCSIILLSPASVLVHVTCCTLLTSDINILIDTRMFTNIIAHRESQLQQQHQNYTHKTIHTAVHYNNIIMAGSERLYVMVLLP